MSDGHQIDAIILDFSKTFNKALTVQILSFRIRGTTMSWIESFLTVQKQHQLIEGAISSEAEVYYVVAQGTFMGSFIIPNLN